MIELVIGLFFLVVVGLIFIAKNREPLCVDKDREEKGQHSDACQSVGINSPDQCGQVLLTQHFREIEKLPSVIVDNIIDGETVDIVCNEVHERIRLDAIDCPKDGQEWGHIATMGLIQLIGERKTVKLKRHGTDIYGRTIGTLFVYVPEKKSWLNVNESMVILGYAWMMPSFCSHLPPQRKEN